MRKRGFHDSIRFGPIGTLKFPNICVFSALQNWAAICELYSAFVNTYDIGIAVLATCCSVQTYCKGLLAKSWLFFSSSIILCVYLYQPPGTLLFSQKARVGWAHPQNEPPYFLSNRWNNVLSQMVYGVYLGRISNHDKQSRINFKLQDFNFNWDTNLFPKSIEQKEYLKMTILARSSIWNVCLAVVFHFIAICLNCSNVWLQFRNIPSPW